MKITELIALENEQIELLRQRSIDGDNEAAQVLLEHLRAVSKQIDDWKNTKVAQETGGRKKRQYKLVPDNLTGTFSAQPQP